MGLYGVTMALSSHGGLDGSPLLLGIILLAGLGTGVLFLASLVVCYRRRSLRYLLVTVAVGALFARSLIGFGTVYGMVPMPVHHLLEHSLDFLIAALILFAVYRSKSDTTPTSLGSE